MVDYNNCKIWIVLIFLSRLFVICFVFFKEWLNVVEVFFLCFFGERVVVKVVGLDVLLSIYFFGEDVVSKIFVR